MVVRGKVLLSFIWLRLMFCLPNSVCAVTKLAEISYQLGNIVEF